MNTEQQTSRMIIKAGGRSFGGVRARMYHHGARQLDHVKSSILAEARATFNAPHHLLRLALNEAEAESWQTEYPHLVFPALATEKIQAVAAWNRRQESLRAATALAA